MKTPRANTTTRSFGGCQLKRVPITIQSKKNPSVMVAGYALSHEILSNQISFFSTQKFSIDDELIVNFDLNGEKNSVEVTMSHLHEQISSGRVMNALPNEQNAFPTRTFYRCYTSVNAPAAVQAPITESIQELKAA